MTRFSARRFDERIIYKCPVVVKLDSNGKSYNARITNYSDGGLYIESDIELDAGTNRLVTITPFNWVAENDDRFENNGISRLVYKIKLENGWSDAELNQELLDRKQILEWMQRKNIRSYAEVGKIISAYTKDKNNLLEKIKRD